MAVIISFTVELDGIVTYFFFKAISSRLNHLIGRVRPMKIISEDPAEAVLFKKFQIIIRPSIPSFKNYW